MKLFALIASLSIISICSSCGEKEPGPLKPVNPELINYFSYQPFSYWIFRDSIAGRRDSFYVSKFNRDSRRLSDSQIGEVWQLQIIQQGLPPFQDDNAIWDIELNYGNATHLRYENSTHGIVFGYTFFTLGMPLVTSSFADVWVDNISDHEAHIIVHPSIDILGQTYANVAEVFHESKLHPGNNCWFYLSPDKFMVKIILNQESVHHSWELEYANIIR